MKDEIYDMIQTCELLPTEDTTRRLLDICGRLNERIKNLEADVERLELQGKRTTKYL